jgi:subtilisin family serine protease
MLLKHTILRDMSQARTRDPFALGPRTRTTAAPTVPEVRVEIEDLQPRDVRDLARDPEVVGMAPVMPTRLVEPVGPEAAAVTAWGVGAIGADVSSFTGAGVTVAVLDTGIDRTHAAFAGVTLLEEDFSGSGNGDRNGHGTHCAGTIFGRDVDGQRIGVARGVNRALIGKVLGDDGSGSSDMIFRAIGWAMNNGAQVASMSLGFDFPGLVDELVNIRRLPADFATSLALEAYRGNLRMFDALMDLAEARMAFDQGVVFVAAAGNESKRDVDPNYEIAVSLPAAAEGIVSVGALGEGERGLAIANFSNTQPQISAPGVGVVSARTGGGLRTLNGTSMACPHVAGAAALWWEAVQASPIPANARTVVAKLLASARTAPLDAAVDIADRGVGIVTAPA